MFAIRARRKVASERDFLDAVEKVVRQGTKFSSTYVFSFRIYHLKRLILCTDRCTKYTTRHQLYYLHELLFIYYPQAILRTMVVERKMNYCSSL